MQLEELVRERIQYFLKEKNMKPWDLYKASGLPKATVYAVISGRNNLPTLGVLLHICEGFNITLPEFFDDPNFEEVVFEKNDK